MGKRRGLQGGQGPPPVAGGGRRGAENGDGEPTDGATAARGHYSCLRSALVSCDAGANVIGGVPHDSQPDTHAHDRQCLQRGMRAVSVERGNRRTAVLAPIAYNAGGSGTEFVAVADVNGDGRSDLIVAVQNDPGGA